MNYLWLESPSFPKRLLAYEEGLLCLFHPLRVSFPREFGVKVLCLFRESVISKTKSSFCRRSLRAMFYNRGDMTPLRSASCGLSSNCWALIFRCELILTSAADIDSILTLLKAPSMSGNAANANSFPCRLPSVFPTTSCKTVETVDQIGVLRSGKCLRC